MQNFQTKAKKENYFLSQVHQPFFLFGVIWAIALMIVFGVAYKLLFKGSAILTVTPIDFHSYSMIYILFTQLFIGFLYTTFPRFCQSEVIEKSYYLKTFALLNIGGLLYVGGAFVSSELLVVGMLFLLAGISMFWYKLFSIYNNSNSPQMYDQKWILIALSAGVLLNFMAILEIFLDLPHFATSVAFTLYLTLLTLSVAQRMVPFFSHSFAEKNEEFLPLVFKLLVLKVVGTVLAMSYFSIAVDATLAFIIFKEFKRWDLNYKQAPEILKILHVALWWLPIAFGVGAVVGLVELLSGSSFVYAQTHLVALGFITTMLIGFGTRVTLGHSGQPPHASSFILKVFYLTQVVVIARFIFSIGVSINHKLFFLFDISLALWLVMFILWAWKFTPVLYSGKKI
ncbi:MAG: NnrS family protein [Helicobacteraceae bacterium]|nr:NnrS family protein [Helicobacteraceae bacterium]